jgi:hypothetical protein
MEIVICRTRKNTGEETDLPSKYASYDYTGYIMLHENKQTKTNGLK